MLEGPWQGDLVVIAFPDRAAAHGWYASPAYQAILPLRTRNATGPAIIVEGAPDGYRAADFAAVAAELLERETIVLEDIDTIIAQRRGGEGQKADGETVAAAEVDQTTATAEADETAAA